MVTGLLILIPLTAIITAYFTLKAYRLGLTHNYQLKHNIEPTKEVNPVQQIIEDKKTEKQSNEMAQIFDEYLNGAK